MRNLALAIVAAACLAVGAVAQTSLTGAGATFPYPMYSKWFNEYQKLNPTIQINYQSIGSGGGIKQVTEGTVDFGATDGPMNDEQIANSARSVDLLSCTSRRFWAPMFPHTTFRASRKN